MNKQRAPIIWTAADEATYQNMYRQRLDYYAQNHANVVAVVNKFLDEDAEITVHDVAVSLEKYAKEMTEALAPYTKELP